MGGFALVIDDHALGDADFAGQGGLGISGGFAKGAQTLAESFDALGLIGFVLGHELHRLMVL